MTVLGAAGATAQESGVDESRIYRIDYALTPVPAAGGANVEMTLSQARRLLRRVDMRAGQIDLASVEGDGSIAIDDGRIVWEPPADGGTLRWFAYIDHLRSEVAYDAHINDDWAVFRADDLMPPTRTRTLKGARSDTWLRFHLPRGWSSLTQYYGRDDSYRIRNRERRFDRPTGWVLLGDIGRRYEKIAGVRVNVAGPVGQDVRRMDMLAMLNWTLPEAVGILPDFPGRLTIVSAGSPMWRGGLSAPSSMFIHADRPLISENGTSTLLHELMHVGMGVSAEDGADWIVEGLAEYYALELLRRSGSISAGRHADALDSLRRWGKDVESLCRRRSTGPVTARAVVIFDALDRDIRRNSAQSLDELVRRMVTERTDITLARLQSLATELTGTLPPALAMENLPGCSS